MSYNVQPLKTSQEISAFQEALSLGTFQKRDQFLFILGINTGLRMGDLLQLRVCDISNRDIAVLQEEKTKKKRTLYLTEMRPLIDRYIQGMQPNQYLFLSATRRKLTVDGVYKIFQKAANILGRNDIGTHTLRKTFGYHYYKKTHDIATLMIIFNHSNEVVTKRYIGITDSEIQKSLIGFKLGF